MKKFIETSDSSCGVSSLFKSGKPEPCFRTVPNIYDGTCWRYKG